jgi:DNA-binding response OmpR family regulator
MGKEKILIIDDDPDMVEALKIILETGGYSVITAYEGSEGLRKAKEENPDLIILDFILPKENGDVICKKIKEDENLSKIPVIILTAMAEKMNIKFFDKTPEVKLPADEYIDKPIQPKDLLEKIEKILRK